MYQQNVILLGMQMRKAIYRGEAHEGRVLLARAAVVHLATTGEDGAPILRTLHAVLDGDALYFHGAPAGEKMRGIGRAAVVSAEETVASIPSFFVDPERACPATTYYVSAQAHGRIEEVTDIDTKACVLEALMTKYQPEGGYVPIRADDPLYRKAVAGLLVACVRIDRIDCKAKLGQNRSPEERTRILELLWERGGVGDVEAIATIVRRFPEVPLPAFLRVPAGSNLRLGITIADDAELDEIVGLLDDAYWLDGVPRAEVRAAIVRSQATISARDERGKLVGFARAVSDGKVAWIYDVIVAPSSRDTGVGATLMRLLLDHPAVRTARYVRLTTKDAMRFYARLGFRDCAEVRRHPWKSTEMIRVRADASERDAERCARVARPDGGQDARLP
jgi:nitroimidazol reductase NimA-like FMN-containing flavoprotein (pyridoxamine 5'-phosphate oxidase superfamily)/ribosomal protein S18 acetylase RimI-like enzyme